MNFFGSLSINYKLIFWDQNLWEAMIDYFKSLKILKILNKNC